MPYTTFARHNMSKVNQQDAERLYDAVSNLVRAYQLRDRERVCCHDISLNQWSTLRYLLEGGPIRLNTLAEHLDLDKSTTSRVVDSLVRKGLVERVEDAEDRRAICLGVSKKGVALYKKIRAGLIAEEELLMADLTPEMRQAAIGLINRLTSVALNAEPACRTGS